MAHQVDNKLFSKILLIFLLFLAQCGVKLPPRATRTQDGPNDAFVMGKTGTAIPGQEEALDDSTKNEESKK